MAGTILMLTGHVSAAPQILDIPVRSRNKIGSTTTVSYRLLLLLLGIITLYIGSLVTGSLLVH